MNSLSGLGGNGYNPYALEQFAQSVFNQADTTGAGPITQSQLEQSVTGAGGTPGGFEVLFVALDPGNTGSVSGQPFAQAFSGPSYSDPVGAWLIGNQAQGWPGGSNGSPVHALAQSLFNQIDTSGSGSITQTQLEQAVTAAGGSTQAADALYAQLDPNGTGSVTAQQLSQYLSQATQSAPQGHHHHHHNGSAGGASASNSADGALTALFNADGDDEPGTSPTQVAQNIFSAIDTAGSGSITQTQLEQAVTAAGGTTAGADALFAALDPGNTGSVSEQQFIQALQPPSPSGNTASDALLALIDPSATNATNASAPTTNNMTPLEQATTAVIGGKQAEADALYAQLDGPLSEQSLIDQAVTPANGSTQAQADALYAQLEPSGTGSVTEPSVTAAGGSTQAEADALYAQLEPDSAGSANSTAATANAAFAQALALYQAQQLYGGAYGLLPSQGAIV